MKLVFERSVPGRACTLLPPCDVPVVSLPEALKRKEPLHLPELAEIDLSRHYTELGGQVFGVNDGFYPLGSCTMKYNPAINEEIAALPGFAGIHPLQETHTVQGCLEVLATAERVLGQVTGMDAMTFQPAAGAHGEYTGMLIISAYHRARGDLGRTKVIVPDSAHGTNPATAAMCGMQVINVPSGADGCVDLDALRAAVGPDTAGLMLTNPNTLGLFDKNILEITQIIHDAGGLNYYDGANLNAVMEVARPGDMGFDVVHLNLHKTFSTPHGGGGPGSGAVGVKSFLACHLPKFHAVKTDAGFRFENPSATIGSVKEFYGNFLIVARALCYALTLGEAGMREASQMAVLSANYMRVRLAPHCKMATDGICMHEFVMSLAELKKETGVSAKDVAKAMLDCGMHAPTMYFPLIVEEALMVEPTETESQETLDGACDCIIEVLKRARENPASVQAAPLHTPIGRPDEVAAARNPKLRYEFGG